ncbi:MAG: ATP synthase F1 subunit gamma [Phycisphaerae bacterium]|nr:ATP synthase F1 subunit gamma [Phycisphaerae bacterium]
MAQIREIKKRRTAVGTIQRITKTMQMIATAKFTAALQRAKATRPYTDKIRQLVSEVASSSPDADDILLRGPSEQTGRHLVLVISSDRGMCGAYNAHILRTSMQLIDELRGKGEVVVEGSGKKAFGFFKFAHIDLAESMTIGDKPQFDQVAAIADRYIEDFRSGSFDAIHVGYMRYESNSKQVPEMMQLLPMKIESDDTEDTGEGSLYEFSPSSDEILSELLPRAVKTSLFQAFNDAVVSEQVMRMVAMKAATDNASELGRILNRDYNRARQTKITTELTEIVSGAAALE